MQAAKAVFVALLCMPFLRPAPSHCQIGESQMVVYQRTSRHGPHLMIDARRGWAVNTGTIGSVVQKTSNGGKTWQDQTPPGFADIAPDLGGQDIDVPERTFGLSALDARRCWVSFGGTVHGREVLVVERTQDGGQHWRRAVFSGEAESTLLQFLDTRHGFLLALGEPVAGLMQKDFYSTAAGGKTWTKGDSPSVSHCNYYPMGMAFRSAREGWITGSNHGTPDVPLVRTTDGGRTWRVQTVDLPDEYAYANTYSPRFFGPGLRHGAFTARLEHGNRSVNYVTHDSGRHWAIAPPARRKHR